MSLKLSFLEQIKKCIRTRISLLFVSIFMGIVTIAVILRFVPEFTSVFPLDTGVFLALVAIIIALYEPLSRVIRAPELKILFQGDKNKKPYLDVFNDYSQIGIPIKKTIYLRPYICNLGLIEARKCEAKVKVWEEGETSPVDYQILHWPRMIPGIFALTPRRIYESIDIGAEERLDLLKFSFDFVDNCVKAESYSFTPFPLYPGKKWKVDVILTSMNSSVRALTFTVDFTRIAERTTVDKDFTALANRVAAKLKSLEYLEVASGKPMMASKLPDGVREYFESQSDYDELCEKLKNVLKECITVDSGIVRELRK